MGATLAETLAEADALAAQQDQPPAPRQPGPPPSASSPVSPGPANGGGLAGILAAVPRIIAGTPAFRGYAGAITGIARAPLQLVGGIGDAAGDLGRFVGDSIDAGMVPHQPKTLRDVVAQPASPKGGTSQKIAKGLEQAPFTIPGLPPGVANTLGALMDARIHGASLADVISMRSSLGNIGDPSINQFTTETGASILPAVVTGGTSLAARMATAAAGGAVGMSAKDAKERGVNAAAFGGLELGGEVVMKGGKLLLKRVIKPATPAEAASDAIQRAAAVHRTEAARYEAYQSAAKGELPAEAPTPEAAASEPAPAKAPAKPSTHPNAALAEDVNGALKASGIEATAKPEDIKLSSSGKVLVDPEVKDAVDEAGYGRAFAATDDAEPHVLFKEEAADGSSRVVGSAAERDLINFSADVSYLRDHPEAIDLPDGSPHGQWTMTQLGAPYDASSVLRAIIDRIPPSTNRLDDKAVMSAAQSAADVLGATPDQAVAFAREVSSNHADLPTAIKALQTVWTRMGKEVDSYAGPGIDWTQADEETVKKAGAAIHNLQMFSSAFGDVKPIPGQALRLQGLPDADSYLEGLARQVRMGDNGGPPMEGTTPRDALPPLPRTRDELKDWLDFWHALKDNPEGRAGFLDGIRSFPPAGKYLRTAIANHFTGFILSAPKTILMNVMGPAVVASLRTVERSVGGAGMAMFGGSAETRAAGRALAAQAPITYFQTLADTADAFRYAAKALVDNKGVLDGGLHAPLDFNHSGVPKPIIEAAAAQGKSTLPYHMGNILNWFPNEVWRLHTSTNEFAQSMAYLGEVRAKAYLEASTGGLKGADAKALVKQRLSEAVDNETGLANDAAALDSSMRTTFIRSPDPEYNPRMSAFMRQLNSLRRNYPELRFLVPVAQVPANAMGETLRRVPGLNLMFKETRDELSGTLGAYRQAEAYGRMMLSTGLLAAAGMWAHHEVITGGGPTDPADRRVWLLTHAPYSMRIGNEWVSFDRLDPVGPLLAMVAGFYDHSVYHDADQSSTMAAVAGLAQYFKDKAAIQGVANLLNFGGEPSEANAIATREGGAVLKGLTVPAFVGQLRLMGDDLLRVKRTPWDYVKDALPGLSPTLDPVRNVLGEPVHKPVGFVHDFLPITHSPASSFEKDPTIDELDRLYQATGYSAGVLSPAGGGQSHVDTRDLKLESGKSLYDALMAARLTSQVDGMSLRESLANLFDSPEYNDAPDGSGRVDDVGGGAREGTRGYMVQQTFQQFNRQAKSDVANASPRAARYLATISAKSNLNHVLADRSVQDLADHPNLFSALGVDIRDYEDKIKGDQ